jgi:hypothetical protein
MSDMSHLGRFLLKIMRLGVLGSAFLLALFLGIAIWQETGIGFMAVLLVLLLGALWLYRAIGRELNNPGA